MDLESDTDIVPDNNNNSDILMYDIFEDPDIIVKLGSWAASIAYFNFQWRFVTLVLYNTNIHIGVESFVRNYDKPVVLKLRKYIPKYKVHVPQFVIFGEDTTDVLEILNWLHNNKYDNTGLYILVCSSPIYLKCNETEIFQQLSQYYYVNSIFIRGSKDGEEVSSFTYNPVLATKCRNDKPVQIDLKNCTSGVCFKNLFPEKMKNLHRCQFVVSTLEQPPFMYLQNGTSEASGADGDIIKLVAEMLNATLVLKSPEETEWGVYENNNWTGVFGDIFNKRAHMSICSAPLTPQIHGNFQISIAYNTIDIVWATRLPMLKPSWEQLLYPLKNGTRVALLVTFIIIICLNRFLRTNIWRNVEKVLNIKPIRLSLLFYAMMIFLGMPSMRLPSKNAIRTIVIYWIWFCYVIRTAYQAALVSSMKLKLYEEYFENFQGILKNNYPFGGFQTLREYYSEDRRISERWVRIRMNESESMLDNILEGKTSFVIALNKQFIIHHLMQYSGSKHLQIIPEKIVNSPSVIYLKKFNPFKPAVDLVLSRMVEGGFVDMFYERYLDRGNYLFRHEDATKVEPLQLSHINSAFIILFVGWFLASIYFVLEVTCIKYERIIKF